MFIGTQKRTNTPINLAASRTKGCAATHRRFTPKKLSLCVAALSCSLSQSLWALGLGEIHSSSLLGEQLRARIAVISDDRSLNADEIRVSRITATEAESLGIDLMSDGHGITVNASDSEQGIMLEVSSRQVISEPFLNFVVKLEWPNGSVYREYTVLLDLPITPVQSNRAIPVKAASKPVPRVAALNDSNQYRVQIGDSLLSLAEQWLLAQGESSTGTSLEATAQWLLQNNPKAFAGGDVNQLMAGALLTWPANGQSVNTALAARSNQPRAGVQPLPDNNQATKAESVARVSSTRFSVGGEEALIHTPIAPVVKLADNTSASEWLASTSFLAEATGPLQELDSSLASTDTTSTSAPEDHQTRLRLGRAPLDYEVEVEQGLQESLASVVQNQIDITHEVIDQLRRDNADLRQKLKRLEQSEYLTTLTELVRLQGLQLAELQAQQSLVVQNQVELAESAVTGAAATKATAATITEKALQTPQETTSVSSMASIMAEVNAAGLVAFAPAAHGGLLQAGKVAGPGSITSIDRAITIAGKAPAAASAIGANSFWRWTMGLLTPLMLMGVYLLVVLRRQQQATDSDALAARSDSGNSFDGDAFNLESFSELTLANLKLANPLSDSSAYLPNPTEDNGSLANDFYLQGKDLSAELITDNNELLDRQTMAELLEQSLDTPEDQQPDLSDNLLLADTVDSDLDDVFGSAMAEVFGEESLARQTPSATTDTPLVACDPDAKLPEDIVPEFKADNVIPFERPGQSDDELKRRIHDKVCDYHPPKPEEAAYIVTESVENIEQYLNIEMIDTPQVELDESRKETLDNPQKD